MSTVITVETTPAVREFQKIYAFCSNKITEASQIETRAFWTNYLTVTTEEFCVEYGLSVDSLVSQWELWVSDVEAARIQARS
jgi:hypothetical protein